MRLVKFKNGSYGIRRGWLVYSYMDLVSGKTFWWSRLSQHFPDCQSSEDVARRKLIDIKDVGEPVKEAKR